MLDDRWQSYLERLADEAFSDVRAHYVPIGLRGESFTGTRASRLSEPEAGTRPDDGLARIRAFARVVVVGEPGSGKTWMLKRLVLDEAARALKRDKRARIPIYVELSGWMQRAGAESTHLIELFRTSIARYAIPDFAMTGDFTTETEDAGFLFVLDGLDEIRDEQSRSAFVSALVEHTRAPGARTPNTHAYVVSSRKYGFAEGDLAEPLRSSGFQFAETTRPSDEVKQQIVDEYALDQARSSELFHEIKSNERLVRLSDNIHLLRLIAERAIPTRDRSPTRARLFQLQGDEAIKRVPGLLPRAMGDLARESLTCLAEQMRLRDRRVLLEDEVISLLKDLVADAGLLVKPHDLLEALLNTRLIASREYGGSTSIQFELPQLEDYFLARRAYRQLLDALLGTDPTRVLQLDCVRKRDLHYVLALAAGLLVEKDAEQLVGLLRDSQYLLIKARIIGEAYTPKAEQQFVRALEQRVSRMLRRTLRSLERWSLMCLVGWWIGFAALSVAMTHPAFATPLRVVTLVLWALAVPLALTRVHRWLFKRYEALALTEIPVLLRALVFVGAGNISARLEKLRLLVMTQRPSARADDVYVQLIDAVNLHLKDAITLTTRDLDTILAALERNPDLVGQYLLMPAEALEAKDVKIIGHVVFTSKYSRGLRKRCLQKLCDVAEINNHLKAVILQLLRKLLEDSADEYMVREAARALKRMAGLRPVATLGDEMSRFEQLVRQRYTGVWGMKVFWLAVATLAPLFVKVKLFHLTASFATIIYVVYHSTGMYIFLAIKSLASVPDRADRDRMLRRYISIDRYVTHPLGQVVIGILLATILAKVSIGWGELTWSTRLPEFLLKFLGIPADES
jgi:hypothetical protein